MTLVSRPEGLRICLCKTCFANEDGKYCRHKLQYNDERGNCATYRSKEETEKIFAHMNESAQFSRKRPFDNKAPYDICN